MENQYCKVGSVTPMASGHNAVSLLEPLYKSFMDKASSLQYANTKLGEFFELKALKIKNTLEGLM